ncbi:MAG TPA: aminopeptidase, partial [Desulfosarcina sp.]|nr:aminopeptidase [Desulfosarcina sp.]
MLTEKQWARYADVMMWALTTARKTRFKKNDIVLLRYDAPARPLAERIHRRLLEGGIHPVVRTMPPPAMEADFYRLSGVRQLTFIPPGEKTLLSNLNGSIFLYAPESITHLSHVDPKRIGRAALARKPLRDILDRRDEQGLFGWTLCMVPTPELARHAGLSLEDYERQVVKACFLNRTQPLAHWRTIFDNARRLKKWLNGMPIRSLRITAEKTDLTITPGARRRWIGLSGHNIPSFELFTSPDWRGTEGVYHANQPSIRSGNYVAGVRLEFKKGRVVSARAEQGEAFLRQQLAMDPGAAQVGEFSLTDRRFSKITAFMANTLYDENFGGPQGNCHIALGSSYSDAFRGNPGELTSELKKALGFNRSALHWDLVNTEAKRVTARLKSGRTVTLYEKGRFCY